MKHDASGFSAIRPLLRRIGLDEKETEIYLAALSLKVARASAIAKAAKVARSNAYLILRSLVEKGLVSEVERGKVIHFVAEPPQRLKQFVEERERELKSLGPLIDGILPMLSSLTKPLTGAPRVTMLRGKEGMRQICNDAFKQELCGVFNPQVMFRAFGGNVVTMILGKKPAMHGRDLLVDGPAATHYRKDVPETEDYHMRTLPKDTKLDADIMIYGDTVAILAYDEELTIVRMQNQNIAAAMHAWFEILWKASATSH